MSPISFMAIVIYRVCSALNGYTFPTIMKFDTDFFIIVITRNSLYFPIVVIVQQKVLQYIFNRNHFKGKVRKKTRIHVLTHTNSCRTKIRDGQKNIDKSIAKALEAKDCIEKHGKTNAQFYTLSRSYYEISGKVADYSMLVDWDASQVLAVLAPYLEKYKKAKKADLLKIVGDHISEKQLRNFLNQLKDSQMIKTEGERGNTVYMLGDRYHEHNDIMTKAIKIGLKALRDNGEIK